VGRSSGGVDLRGLVASLAKPRLVGAVSERQVFLLWKLVLLFYVLELVLNRLLFRVLIFMPPGPVLDALNLLTSEVGVFALNATVVLPVVVLALHARTPIALIVLALSLLDAAGVASVSWSLFLLALVPLYLSPRRVPEALLLVFLALTSLTPSPEVVVAANLLWVLAPLPVVVRQWSWRRLAMAAPFMLASLAMAARSYYITGQILSLGMGIVDPLLLPLAIALYSTTGKPSHLPLLLTGPTMQLSNQALVLAASYIVEQRLRGGGG
jgi:hypothetical protein